MTNETGYKTGDGSKCSLSEYEFVTVTSSNHSSLSKERREKNSREEYSVGVFSESVGSNWVHWLHWWRRLVRIVHYWDMCPAEWEAMSFPRRLKRLDDRRVSSAPSRLTNAGRSHERTCDGKAAYPSKVKAKEYAAIMTRRHGEKQYPYECPACGRWHLTTMRPEEYRAAQRGSEQA